MFGIFKDDNAQRAIKQEARDKYEPLMSKIKNKYNIKNEKLSVIVKQMLKEFDEEDKNQTKQYKK